MENKKLDDSIWWMVDEDTVVLPEGCRMLDYRILNMITDLKAQQMHDMKFKQATNDLIKNHAERLKIQQSQIQQLQLDIERLDKAYYHIFPERLAGDLKLDDQLYKLTSKRPSDGDETKK